MRNIIIDSLKLIDLHGKEEFGIRVKIDTQEYDQLTLLEDGHKEFQDLSAAELFERAYEIGEFFFDTEYAFLLETDYSVIINGVIYNPSEVERMITEFPKLLEHQVALIEEDYEEVSEDDEEPDEEVENSPSNLQYEWVGKKVILNNEQWYVSEIHESDGTANVIKVNDKYNKQLVDISDLVSAED